MALRILDLFCGAGLVYDGLVSAGFEVFGVDLERQPKYPGPFLQHDALTLDDRFYRAFDAVWASPPCLRDTSLHNSARREQEAHGGAVTEHPDLITPTQRLLRRLGLPYVIENVENCRLLLDPVTLCGSMFGLGVTDAGVRFHLERHRKFETNWGLSAPRPCQHMKPVVGVYGGHARNRSAKAGGRGTKDPWTRPHAEIMGAAMGLERPAHLRLTGDEISQGIPPAYAEWIGIQLRRHLMTGRIAA